MAEHSVIWNARFTYLHDKDKFLPLQAIDSHHIVARRSVVKPIATYLFAILLVAYTVFLHFKKGKPVTAVFWSILVGALLVNLLIWRPIVKESLIIMPEFGVQLETHYGSGKISRCFIPVSKILKPLLNEHVTPLTCFWCLSLLLRDEDELTLVFKKFRPPLKLLVPIWKALSVATDCKENCDRFCPYYWMPVSENATVEAVLQCAEPS